MGGPGIELEFSGASFFVRRGGTGLSLDFPVVELPTPREISAGGHPIRILSGVQSRDLHEVKSKPGPLRTKGSGTRKVKIVSRAHPPAEISKREERAEFSDSTSWIGPIFRVDSPCGEWHIPRIS